MTVSRHFTDAMILELRQDYGDPCSECGEDTRCFGCANALATGDELAANLVEIERLTAEVTHLKQIAKEVIDGSDSPHKYSSGQVFVDVGSLGALSAAVSGMEQGGNDSE